MPEEEKGSGGTWHRYPPLAIWAFLGFVAILAIIAWLYRAPAPSPEDIENARRDAVLRELSASSQVQLSADEQDAVLSGLEASSESTTDAEKASVMHGLQGN